MLHKRFLRCFEADHHPYKLSVQLACTQSLPKQILHSSRSRNSQFTLSDLSQPMKTFL